MSQLSRWTLWALIAVCYAALGAAAIHWFTDTWSQGTSLAMLFTLVVGVPSMLGSAGYIWRKNLLRGEAKVQALFSALHPLLLVALWAAVVSIGRLR